MSAQGIENDDDGGGAPIGLAVSRDDHRGLFRIVGKGFEGELLLMIFTGKKGEEAIAHKAIGIEGEAGGDGCL